jgi:predicted NBD/HSP70 family sugar kinase
MKYYAGIDVSLNSSSVCVVDESGKIVREVKVASEPVALIHCVKSLGVRVERIGLERARCRNRAPQQVGALPGSCGSSARHRHSAR